MSYRELLDRAGEIGDGYRRGFGDGAYTKEIMQTEFDELFASEYKRYNESVAQLKKRYNIDF